MEAATSLSRTSSYGLPPLTPPPPSAQRSQNCPQHTSDKLYWVAFVLFCVVTLGMFYLYYCFSKSPLPEEELSPLDELRCAIAEAELDTEFIVGSPQDNWYCVHKPPTSPTEQESTTSLIKKMLEEESRWSDKDSRIPQNWRAFNPFVNMIFSSQNPERSSFLDQKGGSLFVDPEQPSDMQILNIINVLEAWGKGASSDEPSSSSKLGDPIAILQVMIPECLIYYQTHSQDIQLMDKLCYDKAEEKEWKQISGSQAKDRDTRRIELVSEREVRVVWKTHLPLANGSMRVYKITQDITITPQGGSEPCSIKMCRRTERLK